MRDSRSEILQFWFEDTAPILWYQVNEDFDAAVRERFLTTYELAREGACDGWQTDPDGCLALCLLLDQFPRNMFRGTARAYEGDKKAILVAKLAVSKGFDQVITPARRRFIYLPFEHSESLSDQHRCVELFGALKLNDPIGYEYALKHFRVIEQFGRFPHRNDRLGRESTPDELEFLKTSPKEV